MSDLKQIPFKEVQQHKEYGDLWVVINDHVYDLSKFADLHPAGRNVIKDYAGQDVTQLFNQFHSQSILYKYHKKLCIGKVQDRVNDSIVPIKEFEKDLIGEGIPHGDPAWVQGWKSPYYDESHKELRRKYREFLLEHIAPFVDEWDQNKKIPIETFKKLASTGVLPLAVGQYPDEKYWPKKEICGVVLEKPDFFHEIICLEESAKYANIGLLWNMGTCGIGLPPIMNHGSDFLQDKYIRQVLTGEKFICLAITEPWAGSDVANIKTTAKLSPCGKYYVVNGMKKFITTGSFADAFTVAVRTGDQGFFGVSLLVIDKDMPGVKTRAMNMQGVWGSGTGFIVFENVKVPVEQLVGDEGNGFMYIMQNFNHERFQIIAETVSASRLVLEECLKYAHLRKTFNKRLIDQPVIRQKIAGMVKDVETLYSYLELIAYNFGKKTYKTERILASAIAIAKAHGTLVFESVTKEGMQIFGGNGYQRGSVGSKIERYYRDIKSLNQGGGTPEIMFDMAMRQSSKLMPKPRI